MTHTCPGPGPGIRCPDAAELERLRDRVAGALNLPPGASDDRLVAAAFNAYGAAHPEGPGSDLRAEPGRT
jgi:hypothetical protein